jgi:hypothetical protein
MTMEQEVRWRPMVNLHTNTKHWHDMCAMARTNTHNYRQVQFCHSHHALLLPPGTIASLSLSLSLSLSRLRVIVELEKAWVFSLELLSFRCLVQLDHRRHIS